MSKKILSLISIFFLMLFALASCGKAKGIISIQVESEMVVGETYQVKYELEKIDEDVALTWKVSDTGIAELDSKALTIKALKEGSFTLTVTAESGETAEKQVTVVKGEEPATKYTITYELNGGTASNAPAEYDGTKDVTLPTPTKEGYNFKGWYENSDFSGNAVEKIAAGATGNKTFYAKWEEVKVEEETYTITYEVNGGKLSGETTSYTAKDEVTLVAPTFAGYNFLGWYEAADFSGNKVEKLAAGSTGNKTFYAKWAEVEYTITYEVNGGTLEGEETSYTVESQDIILAEPTKEGYIFKGWYTNANFSGSKAEKIAAGSTGNKTFYAKWEEEKAEDDGVYTITYSSNGGTLANAPTEYDGSETIYLVNPLRRGYTFQGWYETSTFAGKAITTIAKGSKGDIHLYAKWVAINYTINYNFNGGEWGETKGVTTFTVAKEIELVAPVREGYTFKGWYKKADFSGEAVEKLLKGTVGTVDLYAKWEALEYTITYNLNEGQWAEGVEADTTYTPDDVITLAEPTRARYYFKGWYETEDFQGEAVTEIPAGTIGNKVFYAKWELAEFYITYNLNEGTWGETVPVTEYLAGTEVTLQEPSREGYTFLGWYENAEFTGEAVTLIGADEAEDKVFYAKWEEIFYLVNFDLDGGNLGVNFTLNAFTEELLEDFKEENMDLTNITSDHRNKLNSTGATKKENFKGTSHPHIIYVFNQADMLAKYKWFFEFTLEELEIALIANNVTNDTYYKSTVEMLEKMIAGDTTAVGRSSYADARTIFRFLIEGVINSKLTETGTPYYQNLMVDYSKAENMARFLEAYYASVPTELEISALGTLPTPEREGHTFLGWYLGEEKVEKVTEDCSLVAKWEIFSYTISWDLAGGAWDTEEGVLEFDYNQVVTLPTPVREGYIFLGWVEELNYVEKIFNKDYELVAKWKSETQTGYEVIFDLNGGNWAGLTLDAFATELVADFNTYGESSTKTERENFKATTHPQIKNVFAREDMLAKYKWFFEFALEELEIALTANNVTNDTYYKSTVEMLEKMIAGDTTAVGGDYADARTIFRFLTEGVINSKLTETGTSYYQNLMVDYSKAENMARFEKALAATVSVEQTIEPNQELPKAEKANYIFLGWTLNGELVEFATGDDVLVAKWIHEDDYEWTVEFDLDGGSLGGNASLDTFATELVDLFNSTGKSDAVTTVRENFKATTHPNIKYVWNNEANLAKYKWFFEFALEELEIAFVANNVTNDTYYKSTVEMLEKMIAGDTTAVGGSSYADARTIFRFLTEGVINSKLAETDASYYQNLMVDYSKAENMARFMAAYEVALADTTFTAKDALPTPKKEGYNFLGWYHNDEKVEQVRGNWKLVAKWEEIKYTISWDLAGGAWDTEEGITEFKPGATVTLPTPVKENHKFLGWFTEDGVQVTEIKEQDYKLVAKWQQTKFSISWDLNEGQWGAEQGVTTFNLGDTVTLPTPVREGLEFLGWFDKDNNQVTEIKDQDYELIAVWKTGYEITWDLAGGEWWLEEGVTKFENPSEVTLPTPVKDGYTFLGWFTKEDVQVTEIGFQDYELVAKWAEKVAKPVVYVGEGLDYATLDAAVEGVAEGTIIMLSSGEYTLSKVITKSVEIVGPNADLGVNDKRNAEAVIAVAKDVASNLAAKNIVFNGVHLKGTGGGPGIPGVYFQDGGSMETLVFKSAVISDMNTFIKFVSGTSAVELTIEDCHIHTIGQFIVWTATGATKKTTLLSNYIDATNCGGVTNADAALFRVRSGSLEVYHNYFKKDSANTPGYFEALNDSVVKYNTFDTVSRFARSGVDNKLVFDQNLYLNASGNALDAAPSTVAVKGVTADTTVAKSVEETDALYLQYVLTSNPDRYFTITFDAGLGKIVSSYPAYYDAEVGLETLPVVELEGYNFKGWTLNGKKVEYIPAGTKGNLTLVAKLEEIALIVDGTTEDGHFATLADALAAAKDGDKIKLAAGEYTENVTISVPNLKIVGPNEGVNAVTGTRAEEAIIKGVWSVNATATNLTIDGLSFTGAAQVKAADDTAGTYNGLVFANNKVYDTNASATAYDAWNRYGLDAFIKFNAKSSGKNVKFEILNNEFKNVDAVNVLVNRAEHLVIDGNVFEDFGQDAIRAEGGYLGGIVAVTNNEFVQTTAGHGHIAFYLVSSSHQTLETYVIVENNLFKQIGQAHTDVFTGAIAAGRFQEQKLVTWSIKGNVFDHCYDIMWLRNNGAKSSNWSCTVENNQFLGLPTNYYYGSYRSDDTESTNPHLAQFGANYYEDNDGNVISDLSVYASYFKHLASYGTALATKPEVEEVEPVKFYTITYDLQEGTTKESFVNEYNSYVSEIIALPTLTKANHQFNGWLLNGELVTEIPASAKGDLHLVADFSVLEGEVYTIEFVNERENAVWPSRGADSREEIVEELFNDLYEWAKGNGETKSYDEYVTATKATLAAYEDIKLRNTKLGNYPAEDGSTEFFFNIPKYYQKWNEFFALFNEAMLNVNSSQVFYTDTFAAMVRLNEFITWSSKGQGYFNTYLPKMQAATKVPMEIPTSYRGGQIVALPQLSMENGLEFLGWYDNAEFTGSPVTSIVSTDSGDKKFYAKWAQEVFAENIEINDIEKLLLFKTHQLVWSITPDNTTNKEVEFFSSDESVAYVSAKGLISALKPGKTTITVKVYGNRELDVVFDLVVYVEDQIEGSYDTTSYTTVGKDIQLNAEVVATDGSTRTVEWKSLTPEIATVDATGVVTAVKAGAAKIVATDPTNPELTLEFVVTVLDTEATGVLGFVLDSHEDNIFTRYNLGIGSGIPEYYMDIFGSVSKLLMGYNYQVDDTRKNTEVNNNTGDYFDSMKSIEFITVHYTGNMAAGADAEANANYFVGDNAVSIHYTTGNDGIYQCLSHEQGAWHAGDSGAYDQVGEFKWIPTGVKVSSGDPMYPEFTISDDFYYEINGKKTSVPMAKPWNYSSRGTDHILNADGTISSKSNFGGEGFTGRTPESFINDMGLPFKIVGDEYYMGSTWWCYTQVYEGRICSTGGNRNSLGIESCVNEGSDLWYTWQLTAQLVARLMEETNLDITRVRGHHFYSGKDCPQPMLANDCEIWREFLSLVEAEYELLTKYSDYEITFVSHNPDIVDNHGRIVKQPDETTCVTYTVTITKGEETQSITLASMVKGLYVDR